MLNLICLNNVSSEMFAIMIVSFYPLLSLGPAAPPTYFIKDFFILGAELSYAFLQAHDDGTEIWRELSSLV